MNSRQRRKANRAYAILKDWAVIRLRLSGEVTEEEIGVFTKQPNFLVRRLAPFGSYWPYLTSAAHEVGVANYARERIKEKARGQQRV